MVSQSKERTRVIHEDCRTAPGDVWRRYLKGTGSLELLPASWRLMTRGTTANEYSNSQIDDYQGLSRQQFFWSAPLLMRIRARFSHDKEQLRGTAGFGFWNDPFLMTGWRLPALPRAVWFFFASSPSNMVLDLDTAGHGWKAMSLDALNWAFIASLPLFPAVLLLMQFRSMRRRIWRPLQRRARAAEAMLEVDMRDWHTYEIAWAEKSRFSVDEQIVLEDVPSPTGPLGFVLWLDNQYAIVTPWGHLGYGVLEASDHQWLEVDEIIIEHYGD